MSEYFANDSIFAVGGSWMVPKDLIKNKDWDAITLLSQQAMAAITSLEKCA